MSERTVVVVVEPRTDAERIAGVVRDHIGIDGDEIAIVMPDDGLTAGFWSEAGGHWWNEQRLDAREVVVLAQHRRGLPHLLWNVASRWLVWCTTDDDAAAYVGHPAASALRAADTDGCGDRAAEALRKLGWNLGYRPEWGPFRPRTSEQAEPAAPTRPLLEHADGALDEPHHVTGGDASVDIPPMPIPAWPAPPPSWPLSAPAAQSNAEPALPHLAVIVEHAGEVTDGRGSGGTPLVVRSATLAPVRQLSTGSGIAQRLRGFLGRAPDAQVDSGALGQSLVTWHDTVVLVGTRKGGVGKTTETLALGYLGALAVEAIGGAAIVIDANLTNADISTKLRLPEEAPKVRELVDALVSRRIPPNPVAVHGSSLRVYGEAREARRYEHAEVEILETHLRAQYALSLVDLPNAVPGLEDRAESVVEAWLPHADVLVIPIDTSIASFEGAADMLVAVEAMKAKRVGWDPGVVIAFLRPSDVDPRRLAPDLGATLAELEQLGAVVVDIPASSRLAIADWDSQAAPLVSADPKVTRAYWSLLAAVVAVRPEAGR